MKALCQSKVSVEKYGGAAASHSQQHEGEPLPHASSTGMRESLCKHQNKSQPTLSSFPELNNSAFVHAR